MINIHDAKTRLSSLLARVAAGEELVIAKAGKPIARLVPYDGPRQARVAGRYAGQGHIAEDFDQPLAGFEDDFYRG